MKNQTIETAQPSKQVQETSLESLPEKLKAQVSSTHIQAMKRRYILGISVLTLAGCAIALYQLFTTGIGTLEISLFFTMYFLTTALGVEVGLHRYFSHKSFKARRFLEIVMAIFGSMAGQGSLLAWVSVHRCHHQYTDRPGDPHSPHLHGTSFPARLKGIWHAHIGWMFDDQLPNSLVFAKDLMQDPLLRTVNQSYLVWLFLGLAIPALLGGMISQTWTGILQGLLWGGIVRLFFSFNTGYLINSLGHVWGKRSFSGTDDQSRNNFFLGIIALGGGWHNNHHTFPYSANNGFTWWQIDLSYWIIRVLQTIGLVWDVKVVSTESIAAKYAEQAVNSGYLD